MPVSPTLMTPPRKILRIITRLNIGGPAVQAVLLSTRLEPQRFSTCLVMGEPGAAEGDLGELLQGHETLCIRVKTLSRAVHPWADAVTLVRLLLICWQERPQIIHTHMAKAGALGRLAGALYNWVGPGHRPGKRAALIHTFHGHVLEGYFSPVVTRFFLGIERWLARRTDCLVAVSPTVRDELLQKGVGRAAQWRVIPLGLDLSALAALPASNGASPVGIGMVGRLVPIKNPHLFLEALQQVVRHPVEPSVSGMIVGDGPLRHALERQAQRLGLEGIVRFTGWQRDLRSVYERLEVACLTSWNEGTPVALIEAMAAGRAVVATDVGGVRDLLGEPAGARGAIAPGTFRCTDRGVLVRAGDAAGLAAALRTVVTDVALRADLARAARAYVLQRFSAERLLRDIAACYESIET